MVCGWGDLPPTFSGIIGGPPFYSNTLLLPPLLSYRHSRSGHGTFNIYFLENLVLHIILRIGDQVDNVISTHPWRLVFPCVSSRLFFFIAVFFFGGTRLGWQSIVFGALTHHVPLLLAPEAPIFCHKACFFFLSQGCPSPGSSQGG